MSHKSTYVQFFITLARVQTIVSRRFDGSLENGLSFHEFVILHHLSQSNDEKMRRTDLAEKVGLTASGVTRLLLPMEKQGLIKREAHEQDGRVSFVKLASGGKRVLNEAEESAERFAHELLSHFKAEEVEKLSKALATIGTYRG